MTAMKGSRVAQATAVARMHQPTRGRRAFCRACRVSFEPRFTICRLCGRPLKKLSSRRDGPTADAPTPGIEWRGSICIGAGAGPSVGVDELGRTFEIEPTSSAGNRFRLKLDGDQIASGPTADGLARWLEAQLADGIDLTQFARREARVGLSGETR